MTEANAQAGNSGHNTKAQRERLAAAFPDLYRKEQEIERAKELHVQPLQDELKRMKQELKTDTGLSLKTINLRYKADYKSIREAADFFDEDERDRALDEIRLAFEAAHPGADIDWIDAIANGARPDAAAPSGEPAPVTPSTLYDQWAAHAADHGAEGALVALQAADKAWHVFNASADAIAAAAGLQTAEVDTRTAGKVQQLAIRDDGLDDAIYAANEAGYTVVTITEDGVIGTHAPTTAEAAE